MQTRMLCCAMGLACSVAAADVAPRYTATLVANRVSKDLWSLNNAGFAGGAADFLVNGVPRSVPATWSASDGLAAVFPGSPIAGAVLGINRFGDAAGTRDGAGFVRQSGGTISPLAPLEPGDVVRVGGINFRGAVLGTSSGAGEPDSLVLWQRSGPDQWSPGLVANAPSASFITPADLNERYDAIGSYANPGEPERAFLIRRAQSATAEFVDLGTLGGTGAQAEAINKPGTIVGQSSDASFVDRAFVWTADDGMLALGDLGSPSARSIAHDISDNGLAVGQIGTLATIWNAGGEAFDLNTLLDDPSLPQLFRAEAINERGQILARTRGDTALYLLNPVPAPGTLALFGLAALATRRRR